ncbi:extracellular solute-binding protein [Paenibacillus illinoisensis]|uniref:extracellular solute-binding protein n=1 Tax=Paenibacillus illinoisensis TaxID=59845 RepID=UPI003D2E55CF
MSPKGRVSRIGGLVVIGAMSAGLLAGCGGEKAPAAGEGKFPISISLMQVGDVPAKENGVEQKIEEYTNTDVNVQWIPQSAFDDKVNVMVASGEMPTIMRVNYVPTTFNAAKTGLFWELGPYLKDYKNLSAQSEAYFNNIKIEGKIYGIPNFRDIGRTAIVYRKDWFDKLKLEVPKTLDDWYEVMRSMRKDDPDGNGKEDTYGALLFKKYNEGVSSPLTRIAVSIGGVNKWGVDDAGKLTPEFLTTEYVDTMKLFKRLFSEGLINSDFPALDPSDADKKMDSGLVGMKLNGVAQNGKSSQQRLTPNAPDGVIDVAPFQGEDGIRIAGEPGNYGMLVIPKAAVPNEEQLKKVLTFLDQLMDEELSTLQLRGLLDVHYTKTADGKTELKDFDAYQREVKPYRDNLLSVEGYNVAELVDVPIGMKGTKMARENEQYAIPNPALTLSSAIYTERGQELDQMIWDAQTKYIMGKIDDAGWEQEVANWRKAGGDQLISELEASYAELNGK